MNHLLNHKRNRIDLATALRAAASFNLNEGICNHFSVKVKDLYCDGIFLNPKNKLWDVVTPEDIIYLSHDDAERYLAKEEIPEDIEMTAFYIHSAISITHPNISVILHTHMPYATSLACIQEPPLHYIHQNWARFYNRIAVIPYFNGLLDSRDEANRLAKHITLDSGIVILPNHGVLVLGTSMPTAFDDLYYFERACQILCISLSTQLKLREIPELTLQATAQQFKKEHELQANLFFDQLRCRYF